MSTSVERLEQVLEALRHRQVDRNRVALKELIGKGGYGDVYLAELRKSRWPASKVEAVVAVKMLRAPGGVTDRNRQVAAFARELVVWANLASPHILPLTGFYLSNRRDEAWLLSPFMKHGDVKQYLQRTDSSHVVRLRLVSEVAQGIEYLHSKNICHGDLKTMNILINDDERAMICDFGVARAIASASGLTTSRPPPASLRYQPPESLQSEHPVHTLAGDIWAFGCVAMEITLDIMPYAKWTNQMALMGAIGRAEPPGDIESGWLIEDIKHVIRSCWASNPDKRSAIGPCTLTSRIVYLRNGVSVAPRNTRSQTISEKEVRELFSLETQLGRCLLTAYEKDGETVQLDEALQHLRTALDLPIYDNPLLATLWYDLGRAWRQSYELDFDLYSLGQAVSNYREAFKLLADNDPRRHRTSLELALSLSKLYERKKDQQTMIEALRHYRWVLETQAVQGADRYRILHDMARLLANHYLHSGVTSSLFQSSSLFHDALGTCLDDTSARRAAMMDLADLIERTIVFPLENEVLDEAIATYRLEEEKEEASQRSRAMSFSCLLGNLLRRRFTLNENILDLSECCKWYHIAHIAMSLDDTDDIPLLIQLTDVVRRYPQFIRRSGTRSMVINFQEIIGFGLVPSSQIDSVSKRIYDCMFDLLPSACLAHRSQLYYRIASMEANERFGRGAEDSLTKAVDSVRLAAACAPVEVGLDAENAVNKYILQLGVAILSHTRFIPDAGLYEWLGIASEVLELARRHGCNRIDAEDLEEQIRELRMGGNVTRNPPPPYNFVAPADEF